MSAKERQYTNARVREHRMTFDDGWNVSVDGGRGYGYGEGIAQVVPVDPPGGEDTDERGNGPNTEANAKLLRAAWNAMVSAADRLDVDALELAEALEDGGFAEMVSALKDARDAADALEDDALGFGTFQEPDGSQGRYPLKDELHTVLTSALALIPDTED